MTILIHGLSGFVPVRNGILLDYCFEEAIKSLLPVCDEVIACDSDSTDGTRELLDGWSLVEPKLRVINYPWPVFPSPDEVEADLLTRPAGNPRMLIAWLNFCREHCRFDTQITLDADEVLDPRGHLEVKNAVNDRLPRWFRRINFWGTPAWEAPHGTVCGERVVKMGPTAYETCSDEPRPEGEPEIRRLAIDGPNLTVFHLGFLRKQNAFLLKSRVMQAALHNCYDPRLREAEKTGKPWFECSPFPADKPLLPVNEWAAFPDYVKDWLRARGFGP